MGSWWLSLAACLTIFFILSLLFSSLTREMLAYHVTTCFSFICFSPSLSLSFEKRKEIEWSGSFCVVLLFEWNLCATFNVYVCCSSSFSEFYWISIKLQRRFSTRAQLVQKGRKSCKTFIHYSLDGEQKEKRKKFNYWQIESVALPQWSN